MLEKVNTLLEAIRPVRLVRDLNICINKHFEYESYFIHDPRAIQNSIFLKDNEFVNNGESSEFKAGNIVSFVAYVENIDMEAALKYILEKYFNKLNQPLYSALNWAV